MWKNSWSWGPLIQSLIKYLEVVHDYLFEKRQSSTSPQETWPITIPRDENGGIQTTTKYSDNGNCKTTPKATILCEHYHGVVENHERVNSSTILLTPNEATPHNSSGTNSRRCFPHSFRAYLHVPSQIFPNIQLSKVPILNFFHSNGCSFICFQKIWYARSRHLKASCLTLLIHTLSKNSQHLSISFLHHSCHHANISLTPMIH